MIHFISQFPLTGSGCLYSSMQYSSIDTGGICVPISCLQAIRCSETVTYKTWLTCMCVHTCKYIQGGATVVPVRLPGAVMKTKEKTKTTIQFCHMGTERKNWYFEVCPFNKAAAHSFPSNTSMSGLMTCHPLNTVEHLHTLWGRETEKLFLKCWLSEAGNFHCPHNDA